MDSSKKNTSIERKRMKVYVYIILAALFVACQPGNNPSRPDNTQIDSVYTVADFRIYGDYYNSDHCVYAVDLLSEGLMYDSLWHIYGSGYNLYLSDVFVPINDNKVLPTGKYAMDSVAREMSFLRGMNFEGSVTGTYLLQIEEDRIQRIVLFTTGEMFVDYEQDNIVLDMHLYTEDSTYYHAIYTGPAAYR